MCGIAGFSGKYPVDETKMRWLITMNESRGTHSTGVFTIGSDKDKKQTLFKTINKATEFVLLPPARDAIRGATSVIAHTRLATSGATNKENAHPFLFGGEDSKEVEVVGVHNGFVIQDIIKKYGFPKTFDVDSMLIFAYLSKNGGDYKVLKDIEGAITIAYMVPKKFPDVIHLYRREARELHFGYTKEGIYFSSEASPLMMIGCQNVLPIPNLTMLALRNGELIDSIDCEPPVIKTIPLNAKRHDWKGKGVKEEYEQYSELKDQPYTKITNRYDGYGSQKTIGFRPSKMDYVGLYNEHKDIVGSLVKEIVEDSKFILSTKPPHYVYNKSYDLGDLDSCLMLIKLCNSANKNQGLPGFVVFDKADPTICGVTAPNGITLLKYPRGHCPPVRTLITADPVDGKSKFEITVQPQAGRVVEVTLQLPFPQEEKEQATCSATPFIDGARQRICEIGRDELHVSSPQLNLARSLFGPTDEDTDNLSQEEAEVSERSEKEQISGIEGSGKENAGNIFGPFRNGQVLDGHGAQGGHTGVRELVPNTLTPEGIEKILKQDRNAVFTKAKINTVFSSPEYHKVYNVFEKQLGSFILVSKLLLDAALLKAESKMLYKNSFALGIYAVRLLEVREKEYYMTAINVSTLDKVALITFIDSYRKGIFTNPAKDILSKTEHVAAASKKNLTEVQFNGEKMMLTQEEIVQLISKMRLKEERQNF